MIEEENNYFKNIVKDAIKDLKSNKQAFAFFEEQVIAIKESLKDKNIIVEEKEGIYYLTIGKKCGSI